MCVRVKPFRRASGPVASAGAGVEVVCVAPSGAAVSTHHIRTRQQRLWYHRNIHMSETHGGHCMISLMYCQEPTSFGQVERRDLGPNTLAALCKESFLCYGHMGYMTLP